MCAYRVVRDVTFSENFAYVVNEWPPQRYWDFYDICTKFRNKKNKNRYRRNNETFFMEFSFWGFFVVSYFPLKDMINVTYFKLSWMIIGQLPHKHSSRIVTPSVTPLHLPPSHFPWIFTTKDIYPPDFHHSTRYFSNCNNSASVYLTKTNCLNFKVWDHRSK